MAPLYPGYWPSVVAKDAKYHVTATGRIRLIYRDGGDLERHVEIEGHDELTALVNSVKLEYSGREGGVFYLNEYRHVVVPVIEVNSRVLCFAGHYAGILEFPLPGMSVGPMPPRGLRPGDEWPGPHVGIPYTLSAGGEDIRYESRDWDDANLIRRVALSGYLGSAHAKRLAQRLGEVKGWQGGRIYINEARAFFAPVPVSGVYRHLYLGMLDGDPWFPEPEASNQR